MCEVIGLLVDSLVGCKKRVNILILTFATLLSMLMDIMLVIVELMELLLGVVGGYLRVDGVR